WSSDVCSSDLSLRSEAVHESRAAPGLPRRFAPRNDGGRSPRPASNPKTLPHRARPNPRLRALHRRDELGSVWGYRVESAVMAGDYCLEVEVAFDRQRRHRAVHREAAADRDEADFRRIKLRYQRHVAKDSGVAHVI